MADMMTTVLEAKYYEGKWLKSSYPTFSELHTSLDSASFDKQTAIS